MPNSPSYLIASLGIKLQKTRRKKEEIRWPPPCATLGYSVHQQTQTHDLLPRTNEQRRYVTRKSKRQGGKCKDEIRRIDNLSNAKHVRDASCIVGDKSSVRDAMKLDSFRWMDERFGRENGMVDAMRGNLPPFHHAHISTMQKAKIIRVTSSRFCNGKVLGI